MKKHYFGNLLLYMPVEFMPLELDWFCSVGVKCKVSCMQPSQRNGSRLEIIYWFQSTMQLSWKERKACFQLLIRNLENLRFWPSKLYHTTQWSKIALFKLYGLQICLLNEKGKLNHNRIDLGQQCHTTLKIVRKYNIVKSYSISHGTILNQWFG